MEDKEKKDITKTKKELTQGICPICGKESEGTLVTHYISYVPPKVIFICDRCHTTIHQNNNKLRMFEPLLSRKDLVASEKYTHIDTITFKGKDIPFYTPNSVYPIFNKKSHLIEEKKKIIRTINELKQKKEELEEEIEIYRGKLEILKTKVREYEHTCSECKHLRPDKKCSVHGWYVMHPENMPSCGDFVPKNAKR